MPLHAGAHGDGRPVREDALTGDAEEHQLGGAGHHAGGRPAQIQHQVCRAPPTVLFRSTVKVDVDYSVC